MDGLGSTGNDESIVASLGEVAAEPAGGSQLEVGLHALGEHGHAHGPGRGHHRLVNNQTERLFGYRRTSWWASPSSCCCPSACARSTAVAATGTWPTPVPGPWGAGSELAGRRKRAPSSRSTYRSAPSTPPTAVAMALIRDVTSRKEAEETPPTGPCTTTSPGCPPPAAGGPPRAGAGPGPPESGGASGAVPRRPSPQASSTRPRPRRGRPAAGDRRSPPHELVATGAGDRVVRAAPPPGTCGPGRRRWRRRRVPSRAASRKRCSGRDSPSATGVGPPHRLGHAGQGDQAVPAGLLDHRPEIDEEVAAAMARCGGSGRPFGLARRRERLHVGERPRSGWFSAAPGPCDAGSVAARAESRWPAGGRAA